MTAIFQKISWCILLFPCLLVAQNETFYTLKSYNHINDLAIDSVNIWAATTNGLVQRNKATGEICAIYNASNSPLTEENVTEVALSPDGDILVGTYDGRLHTLVFGEWYLLDSLQHEVSGVAFYQNEQRIAEFYNSRESLCHLFKDGSYSLFETAEGDVYRAYLNAHCQAFPCCCASKTYSLENWNGTNWDTLKIGTRDELAINDFVVTTDNQVWAIYDSTLFQYQISADDLTLMNSQNPNLGALQSISLAPDGVLWLITEAGVFTFENNVFTPKNEGLNQLLLTDIHFDENGTPYANSRYGLFEMENDVWTPHFYGLLNDENATGIFAKNGDAWFPENHGMSLFDGENIEHFTFDNSILTVGTNEIIHADSQSNVWLSKLNLNNVYQLFHYNGNDWMEIDAANSGLTSLNFDTIISDNSGNVWFKYADGSNAAARFDFQNWINFSTLNEYNAANFPPQLWTYSEALPGMIKNDNGVITEFPINVGPADLNLTETSFTQAGHAWVVHEDLTTEENSLLYFDGEIWAHTHPFLNFGYNYNSVQKVKRIFAKADKAWFFNETSYPAVSYDYFNSYDSHAYRFTGNSPSSIRYPYALECDNTLAHANASITILDVVATEEHFWVVYDLSRIYTFIIFDACGTGCGSNVLVKVDEQATFNTWPAEFPAPFTQRKNKELGQIRHLKRDLQDHLWMFHDDKITTFRELPPLLATFSQPAFCNEGQALACVTSGGLAPFNYQWNDGTTNPLNAPIAEGTYSVTLTDANNYQRTGTEEIAGNALLITIQSTVQPPACDDSGQVEIQVNGGVSPYQYLWEDGTTTANHEGLTEGVYELTVTDAVGCTIKEIYQLENPPPILIEEDRERVSCVGSADGQIEITTSGGVVPHEYLWSNGATTALIDGLVGGLYTVTITDAVGCTEEKSISVNEANAPLDATAVIQPAGCGGQSNGAIDLTATGGIGSKDYQWSNGATTADIDNLAAGIYELTLTDGNGFGNFCTEIFTFEVEGSTVPMTLFTTNFQPITCANASDGSVTAGISGGVFPYEFLWSNGVTTAQNSNLDVGMYTVTITDAFGCTITESYNFNQPQAIEISDAATPISCFGETDGMITANVSGGVFPYEFSWSTGETEANIQDLAEGTYELTLTDAFGCTATQLFVVTEPAELLLDLTSETPMVGESNGSVTTAVSGGTPPFSYLWNTGVATADLVGISGGNYSVTITDDAGCQVETSFYLHETALDDDTGMNLQTNTDGNEAEVAIFKQKQSKKADSNAAVVVFPNPFSSTFFIKINAPNAVLSNVEIYHAVSQKMDFQWTKDVLENTLEIETTGWSSGTYLVKYQVDGVDFVERVVRY